MGRASYHLTPQHLTKMYNSHIGRASYHLTPHHLTGPQIISLRDILNNLNANTHTSLHSRNAYSLQPKLSYSLHSLNALMHTA